MADILSKQQHTGVEKQEESTFLAENKDYKNGLIVMRKRDDRWFATIGNHKVTNTVDTEEELIKEIENPTIETMFNVAMIVNEITNNNK